MGENYLSEMRKTPCVNQAPGESDILSPQHSLILPQTGRRARLCLLAFCRPLFQAHIEMKSSTANAMFRIQPTSSLLLFILLFLTSAMSQAAQDCPGKLFATGFDRQTLHGSRAALIAAIQRGDAIRVGWELDFDSNGEPDIAHWSEAAFLSVRLGEVHAQVLGIHRQKPSRESGAITLPGVYGEWRGLLGTTGVLQGSFSDGTPMPDSIAARIVWCTENQALPTLLFRNGINGETLAGSRAALLNAIRSGQTIHMGWGLSAEREGQHRSVEHVIAPVYVGIVHGEEVVAQLPEHIALQAYADADRGLFEDPAVMWRGMMTTRGSFDAVWVNRSTGEVVRRFPQRAAISWFGVPAPVETPVLSVPGGVTIDRARDADRLPQ